MLFVIPLVTGILLLIPGQSTTSLGIEIAAFGLLVGRTLPALGGGDLEGEPRALVSLTASLRAGSSCSRCWPAASR